MDRGKKMKDTIVFTIIALSLFMGYEIMGLFNDREILVAVFYALIALLGFGACFCIFMIFKTFTDDLGNDGKTCCGGPR